MHHVEISLLLQALLVVLLVVPAAQIVRVTRWRGRLALLVFALFCAVTNPGRTRHVRAMQRAVPEADARLLNGLIEYHDFIVLSAASVEGRLVSLGMFDHLWVGAISCRTLSTMSDKSSDPASKGMCPQ